ncbi:hypothetical protein BASA60_003217 [Batrachochytrium salamandrivorans]|nr:hypothetical protein BASA60_003217 [Batrachochytrium salamandrivorans]
MRYLFIVIQARRRDGSNFWKDHFCFASIFSNIHRNSRHAFNRSYVVGTSLTRLLLPVYAWYYQGDIIALHEPPTTGQLVAYSSVVQLSPVSPSLSDDGFISLQLGSATDAASHTTRAVDPSSASSTSISSPVLRRSHSTSFTTPSLVSEALPGRNQCAICSLISGYWLDTTHCSTLNALIIW